LNREKASHFQPGGPSGEGSRDAFLDVAPCARSRSPARSSRHGQLALAAYGELRERSIISPPSSPGPPSAALPKCRRASSRYRGTLETVRRAFKGDAQQRRSERAGAERTHALHLAFRPIWTGSHRLDCIHVGQASREGREVCSVGAAEWNGAS
jgi:hypothetical protein